ncbi:MAG: tyrosine-type recombinase/integrase [Acetobacteraceae bacterium]|nr:tyrosine-type recombinase/integrase [Acetobacteraceae bacterium]
MEWPLAAWPEIDQDLWRTGLAAPGGNNDDGLDEPAYAARLSQATIVAARGCYGRWLAVLHAAGELDPAALPATRVTRARAKLFLRALQACGNANHTIRERFRCLRRALRILQPEAECGWLTARLGLLPVAPRPVQTYDSAVLEAWGHELMQDALRHPRPLARRTGYRNGLLIAILATRAPRLRALAAMRLRRQVLRDMDGGWRLAFRAEDIKTQRPVEYALPASLGPCLEHYLEVERPELLQGHQHDWFWVNCDGKRLAAKTIVGIVKQASRARFGAAFGPHRFRHSLATTAAYADPANPGLAAAVLAISEPVLEAHYNQARHDHAVRRFQQIVHRQRARTAPRAESG